MLLSNLKGIDEVGAFFRVPVMLKLFGLESELSDQFCILFVYMS